MPCYLIQEATVNLGAIASADLASALTALGLTANVNARGGVTFSGALNGQEVRGTFQNGTLAVRDLTDAQLTPFTNTIKRQLSAQAIKVAAKAFRFDVKQVSATKFVATKRRA